MSYREKRRQGSGYGGYARASKRLQRVHAHRSLNAQKIDEGLKAPRAKTAETVAALEKQKRLPKAILSDHGSQFKEQWKKWYSEHCVEAHFAHPSYLQDKARLSGAFRT